MGATAPGNRAHAAAAFRPRRRGPRQFHPSRARQCHGARPAAGDIVLCRGPRADARSLSDGERHQHVGECRQEPVSSAGRTRAGAARPYRADHSRPRARCSTASPRVAKKLEGTAFKFSEHNDYVEATCPWGNRYRCYEPDVARFGRINLGIPYVEFDVPDGTAKAIADFYPAMVGIPAELKNGDGMVARAKVGKDQYLQFRETDDAAAGLSTATTCRSTSPIFPAPIAACSSATSSRRKTISTSTASRTSSISRTAGTSSPSSTRCAA